jgi:hypothetical protein
MRFSSNDSIGKVERKQALNFLSPILPDLLNRGQASTLFGLTKNPKTFKTDTPTRRDPCNLIR